MEDFEKYTAEVVGILADLCQKTIEQLKDVGKKSADELSNETSDNIIAATTKIVMLNGKNL